MKLNLRKNVLIIIVTGVLIAVSAASTLARECVAPLPPSAGQSFQKTTNIGKEGFQEDCLAFGLSRPPI